MSEHCMSVYFSKKLKTSRKHVVEVVMYYNTFSGERDLFVFEILASVGTFCLAVLEFL